MPLPTQIVRDGEPLSMKWGSFHIAAMVYAASIDSGVGPFVDMDAVVASAKRLMEEQGCIGIDGSAQFDLSAYHILAATPLNSGSYTLKGAYRFHDNLDGEVLDLQPGDELHVWRN